jgi:hypothetical protein
MKQLLTIVAVTMCAVVLLPQKMAAQRGEAQQVVVHVPEEEDILAKTISPDSPYFYMPMMRRYMEGDTTLTDEHYFYLYYGYAYEADYDAHRELPGEGVIYEVFRRTERPSREDALAIIEAGRENMLVDPFSPSNINLMTYAYQLAGDSIGARISADRFAKIVRTITSSGTGMRDKSPWHILRFTHANDIIAAQGLTVAKRTVRTRDVEYIQVEPNDTRVKGYFFDFSRVYWKPYEGERVKKDSNWMFNGTPL